MVSTHLDKFMAVGNHHPKLPSFQRNVTTPGYNFTRKYVRKMKKILKFLPKSLILFSDFLFNHPAGYPHDLGNLSSGSSRSSSEERRNLAKYGTKMYEVLPPFWCFDVFFTRKVAPDRSY